MSGSIKALIVVLAIAAIIFRFAKPIALRFSAERDFARRRNVWFALTATAFLSPNFWLFAMVAIPLLAWAGRRDTNPVALYLLLLHVIPPIAVKIPAIGINALFDLDNYGLLSFCVLIPAAWRLRQSNDIERIRGVQAMDLLLLGYGVLNIARFIQPDLPGHVILLDSPTNVLRRAFLFFVDVYVLYFVVSRSCSGRRAIIEAQAAFCLSCAVMAAVAIFETERHWLLYADIIVHWSSHPPVDVYLMRNASLRAQASAGHSLALGYLLAIAFGFWLYLKSNVKTTWPKITVMLLLLLGLLSAYSRGPWVGAAAIYVVFATLGRRSFRGLFKAGGAAVLVAGIIVVSPLRDRVANVLPFLGGSVDIGSVLYRQRLFETALELIKEHPIFGDQLAVLKMESLRQGEGIIDIVNTYVQVALNYGLTGLSLFLGFFLTGLFKVYRTSKQMVHFDPDLASLGISLVACIVGTLLMIENASFRLGYERLFYVLAGLAAAYAYHCRICLLRSGVERGGRRS